MAKTIEESWTDWESEVFGLGYGTGEIYVIGALKAFLGAVGIDRDGGPMKTGGGTYDYRALEAACGPAAAWLLINRLCRIDIIDYGVSPRFGWLSPQGEALKAFVDAKSIHELISLTEVDQDYTHCAPAYCNCGPKGFQKGVQCINPFWICK
jgi:hypothetical protein